MRVELGREGGLAACHRGAGFVLLLPSNGAFLLYVMATPAAQHEHWRNSARTYPQCFPL